MGGKRVNQDSQYIPLRVGGNRRYPVRPVRYIHSLYPALEYLTLFAGRISNQRWPNLKKDRTEISEGKFADKLRENPPLLLTTMERSSVP